MDEIKATSSDKPDDVQGNSDEAHHNRDLLQNVIGFFRKLQFYLFPETSTEKSSEEIEVPADDVIETVAGENLEITQGNPENVQESNDELKNAFDKIQGYLSEIEESIGILVRDKVTLEDPVLILQALQMRVYDIHRSLPRGPVKQKEDPFKVVAEALQTPALDSPAATRRDDFTEPTSPEALSDEAGFNNLSPVAINKDDFTGPASPEGLSHEAALNNLSPVAINRDDFNAPPSAERFSDEPPSDGLSPEATMKGALVSLYNEAAENRDLRDSLWEKFHITLIENVNALDQRIGNTPQPEFRQSNNGNFYAVEDTSSGTFLVVPKFDFTIKSLNYESTVKFGFICPDFDDNCTYSRFTVLEPALFVKYGDIWRVDRPGRLNLIG